MLRIKRFLTSILLLAILSLPSLGTNIAVAQDTAQEIVMTVTDDAGFSTVNGAEYID